MKPILFSPPMVKAILEGKKCMTRRTMKDVPTEGFLYDATEKSRRVHGPYHGFHPPNSNCACGRSEFMLCPYGQAGDILWVKEAFYGWGHWEEIGTTKTGKVKKEFVYDSKEVSYDAPFFGSFPDGQLLNFKTDFSNWHKRNSLFMPFWASRIQLEITKVRCERIQDITEEEAKNEGVQILENGYYQDYVDTRCSVAKAVHSFASLIDSINGFGTWDMNPWVWVIEFRRIK